MNNNFKIQIYILPGLASAAGAVLGALLNSQSNIILLVALLSFFAIFWSNRVRIPFMLAFLICIFNIHSPRTSAFLPFKKVLKTEISGKINAVEHKNARTSLSIATARWGNLRLLYNPMDSVIVYPGDSITAQIVIHPLKRELNIPGNFNLRSWMHRQNIQGQGRILQAQIFPQKSFAKIIYQIRQYVLNTSTKYISNKTAGLVPALLTGDRSLLDRDISTSFRNSGLVHVLAVSGFHVVLIATILQILVQNLRLNKNFQRIFASILLFAYMFITGASPSVMRAVIMFISEQLTAILQRPVNSMQRLGIAISAIIIINPAAVWDLGMQLSCGATAGILISNMVSPLEKLKGFKKIIASSIWISFGATCGTLPILIYNFQNFAPLAWIGNLCVVPLISLAMQSGIFMILFSFSSQIAQVFASTTETLLSYSVIFAKLLSEIPGAKVTLGPWPQSITLIMIFTMLFLPLLLHKNHLKAKLLVSLGLACFGAYQGGSVIYHHLNPSAEIFFLDAGQGDCTILKFSHGKAIVIDVGNEANRGNYGVQQLAPFLRRNNIHQIDALIITHPHSDHFGGLESLLDEVKVQQIWIPWQARFCDNPFWQKALQKVQNLNIPIHDVYEGQKVIGLKPWNMKFLFPYINSPVNPADWNSISIVALLQYQNRDLSILPGDLGSKEEDQIMTTHQQIQSPILKLGHHGSHYSSSTRWLKALKPQIAIASAGYRNRYRHPSAKTLARLDSLLIPTFNTATDGSIFLKINAKDLRANPYLLNFTQITTHQ
ncbi:MAG: DNA internalization-related competence protein ComEC/Rec2 [Fibrobacter sp.]|nr:DNA internalization-related competence protein ComEC/Rec2 [Fibrobacter sp.]